MTSGDFRKAHRFTVRWEKGTTGGPAFADRGRSFLQLRRSGLHVRGATDAGGLDVAGHPAPRAAGRVRRALGASLPIDELPPRCAMVLYDTAVGMGPMYAAAVARRALGFSERSPWNERLLSAFRHCNDARTSAAICHLRRARYCETAAENPHLRDFLPAWLGRVDALEEASSQMKGPC